MHYFEYAEKDSTLYSRSGSQNTGIDEILEVVKDTSSAGVVQGVSRILIKFDTTYISSSISSGLIPSSSYTKFYLNLYDANSRGLNVNQNLYAYPISQSWDMGFGKEDNFPIPGFRERERDEQELCVFESWLAGGWSFEGKSPNVKGI